MSLAVWGSVGWALPQNPQSRADAQQQKARALHLFAWFTEWPATGDRRLRLCVLGRGPLDEAVLALQGQAVGQRRIEVLPKAPGKPLLGCELVFIARTAIDGLPQALNDLRGAPVLTVADTPGAAQQGVMLNLATNTQRISFEANLGAARAARLRLNAPLLRLATTVWP